MAKKSELIIEFHSFKPLIVHEADHNRRQEICSWYIKKREKYSEFYENPIQVYVRRFQTTFGFNVCGRLIFYVSSFSCINTV